MVTPKRKLPDKTAITPIIGTQIDTVTIYRVNALVTRKAALSINKDGTYSSKIKISNLPLSLDDSSLRVRVSSGNDILPPIAHDIRVMLEVPELDPDLQPPHDKALQSAEHEVIRIRELLRMTETALQRLDIAQFQNRCLPEEIKSLPQSPLTARLTMREFCIRQRQSLMDKKVNLKLEYREAKKKQRELEDQQRRASNARQNREHELSKAIIISLQSPEKVSPKATLYIEYLVPGARWAPAYAMRFSPDFNNCAFSMRAMVCQQTGEDWLGAKLVLSTAESLRTIALPELLSKRYGRPQPLPLKKGWRPPPIGAEELFTNYDQFKKLVLAPPPLPAELGSRDIDNEEGMKSSEAILYDDCEDLEEECSELCAPSVVSEKSSDSFKRKKEARPMSKAPQRSMSIKDDAFGGAPKKSAPPQPNSEELQDQDEMLDYERLRFRDADSTTRAKLQIASQTEQYLRWLPEDKRDFSYDVVQKINENKNIATNAGQQLPPSCSQPSPYEGYDHIYISQGKLDVPSDGQFHMVSLFNREAKADLRYVIIPRESTDAFRMASFFNPMDAPLLTGPVDVSLGADFLLSTLVPSVPKGGHIELGLGVEQGIKAARNTHFKEETSGLAKANLSLQHTITIEISNNLSVAAKFEVRDRICVLPHDKDDKFKVVVNKVDPPWKPFLQLPHILRGGHYWTFDLASGAKQTLKTEYEINLPAQYEIIGGNRRED